MSPSISSLPVSARIVGIFLWRARFSSVLFSRADLFFLLFQPGPGQEVDTLWIALLCPVWFRSFLGSAQASEFR